MTHVAQPEDPRVTPRSRWQSLGRAVWTWVRLAHGERACAARRRGGVGFGASGGLWCNVVGGRVDFGGGVGGDVAGHPVRADEDADGRDDVRAAPAYDQADVATDHEDDHEDDAADDATDDATRARRGSPWGVLLGRRREGRD